MEDLVALSGGHTLGFSHCSSFAGRIHNFNAPHNVDPSMHPSLAASLRGVCPRAKNAGTTTDPSSTTFDNTVLQADPPGEGPVLFGPGAHGGAKTKGLVEKFAGSHEGFVDTFMKSMIMMSSITGGEEVNKDCRVVN